MRPPSTDRTPADAFSRAAPRPTWLEQELGGISLAAQRAVKRALDPAWLMNPGKVL